MPTYEYRCKDCGHDLEAQQAFSDDPLTECPACGGLLKKRFSSPGISFKGSGFYKTDSRSGSSAKSSSTAGDGAGTSSSDAGNGSSSGSDSAGAGSTAASGASTPSTPAPSTSSATTSS